MWGLGEKSMTKKRLLFVDAALLGILLLALLSAALLVPSPGVSKANFERIALGMSFAEVTTILGEPQERLGWEWDSGHYINTYFWKDPRGHEIYVRFDSGEKRICRCGIARSKNYYPPPKSTFIWEMFPCKYWP